MENLHIQDSHANVPNITNYLTPVTNFNEIKLKIEAVLQSYKSKIDEDSLLIVKDSEEISINENEFSKIKCVKNYDAINTGKYNLILDCLSFIHREDFTQPEQRAKTISSDLLKLLLNSINDKGVLMCLMDFHYLIQIYKTLQEVLQQQNYNILIKLYIIEKLPLVGLISIQKYENSTCNLEKLKLLSYEIYEDNSITKPISYFLKDISRSVTYMNEMYQYQGFMSVLHPDELLKVNIRENFWSDNIDFCLTIVDSKDPELQKLNTCAAIIVTKSYAGDFIYISKEGNMALCKQVSASRIILIRPNAFNYDSVQVIKDKISHYILLFKFKSCVNKSIPILLMSDSNNEQYEVYKNDKITIRDHVENEKKETFRQLIFNDAPTEIQSEIKLILTTKAKAKTDPDFYTVIPTINKYKEKHLIQCIDKNFISSYYIKSLLCGIFFIPVDNFPSVSINLMVLGAGIGTVNHFFNKIFKDKIQITSCEIDKTMPEIGQKYFGLKNFDVVNYNWVYGDACEFIANNKLSNKSNYDLIISDINNTNASDGLSPPPVFFSDDVLSNIKDGGVYIINLMARSYVNYNHALSCLEKHFENIFVVENDEDLNKIHFCFKKKLQNEDHVRMFKNNLENFKQNADISIIENDYKRILSRIIDRSDLAKK